MPIGMGSRLAATAAVGPFMDSLRMRSREGSVNVPNRRSGKAGERGQCAARRSRKAYHRVAVTTGGGLKAGQLTSGHASKAQTKLCSLAHHGEGSRGSPCHRCTSTFLVPAKLKGASQEHQQRVLEVATCGGLQAAPTSGARSSSRQSVAESGRPQVCSDETTCNGHFLSDIPTSGGQI